MVGARGFEPPTPCSQSEIQSFSPLFNTLHSNSLILDIIKYKRHDVTHGLAPLFTLKTALFVPRFVPRKK